MILGTCTARVQRLAHKIRATGGTQNQIRRSHPLHTKPMGQTHCLYTRRTDLLFKNTQIPYDAKSTLNINKSEHFQVVLLQKDTIRILASFLGQPILLNNYH